jgi:hypothetical protein
LVGHFEPLLLRVVGACVGGAASAQISRGISAKSWVVYYIAAMRTGAKSMVTPAGRTMFVLSSVVATEKVLDAPSSRKNASDTLTRPNARSVRKLSKGFGTASEGKREQQHSQHGTITKKGSVLERGALHRR